MEGIKCYQFLGPIPHKAFSPFADFSEKDCEVMLEQMGDVYDVSEHPECCLVSQTVKDKYGDLCFDLDEFKQEVCLDGQNENSLIGKFSNEVLDDNLVKEISELPFCVDTEVDDDFDGTCKQLRVKGGTAVLDIVFNYKGRTT